MRTVRRLRLRFLLDLRSSPTVLPSLLSTPVECQCHPHLNIPNILRWRCRESNPGPEVLRFEGITTILYSTKCTTRNTTIKTATIKWYAFIVYIG